MRHYNNEFNTMRLIYLFIAFLVVQQAFTQVVINEYSCSNISNYQDNYSEYEDWIELYNTSATNIDLTGYYLSDKPTNPTKWVFPAITIPANGHLIIFASGRDEYSGGNLHSNFKLTQTKPEKIIFSNPSGTIIEQVTLSPNQINHSRGKTTDGASTWSVFTTPTPGATNINAMDEYATTPIFSLSAGLYTSTINLDITSPDPNITIYYTTDGTSPTIASTPVSGSINISSTTVIKAKAFSSTPTIPPSFIETNTYFINDVHTMVVLSISGDQLNNLLNGSYIEPEGVLEYFNANQVLVDEASGFFNKHGNDSWAYNQRGVDFIAKDQFGINNVIHEKIFRTKSRNKFQRLIIKAAANDNYPFETGGAHIRDSYVHSLSQIGHLKLDERSYEPCVLYLNGEYWGVYDIREKVDDADFTDYYFDQDKDNLQFLKTWGGTWAEYGGVQAQTDWDDIKNYILSNDMSVQSNFDYVTSVYNWKSLVDYVVLNSYVVCSDWLNWNTAWWRGLDTNGSKRKWRYSLWDMDATFGHYINYTGIPSQNANADPCNPEDLSDPGGQGHIPILNALMNNETFKQYYIARYADLSNTVFSCDFMQAHLDSLIDIIEPEMQRQVNKWGGTMPDWQANVQTLRDFLDDRCAEISDGMLDCYNLTGPFQITVLVEPAGSGDVVINSIDLSDYSYPWTGTFYGAMNTLLYANDAPGWDFDYWELTNNTVLPNINDENVTADFVANDTIIAHFKSTLNVYIGNDTTICFGDSILLDAGHSGATFIWQDGSTDSTLWVSDAGTYSVTVNEGFGTGNASITVTINSASTCGNITLCNGTGANLHASGGVSYLWSPAGSLNSDTIQNPIANPSITTTYIVTVTDNVGCEYIDELTVFVSPGINLDVSTNNDTVCPNENVSVSILITGGIGAPYSLYMDGSNISNSVIVNPNTTTIYQISAQDDCGTYADTFITIYTYPIPTINISSNYTSGCQPFLIEFIENGSADNQHFIWDFGDSFMSVHQNPQHLFETAGVFDISIEVENIYGCKNSKTIYNMINIYPKPSAKFTANPEITSIIKPTVYFTNHSLLADTLIWNFGDGIGSILENPVHTFPNYTSKYNVELIASTKFSCRDTANMEITIKDEFTFFAPTAFSPDFDGINDIFRVYGNGIDNKNFNMIIYNRWGEIIFETNDMFYGWNGMMSGKVCNSGTYSWLVKYKNLQGIQYTKTGIVTLIR